MYNVDKWWSHDNYGFKTHQEVLDYEYSRYRKLEKFIHKSPYSPHSKTFNFDSLISVPKSKLNRNPEYEKYFLEYLKHSVEVAIYFKTTISLVINTLSKDWKRLKEENFYDNIFLKDVYKGSLFGTSKEFISELNTQSKEIDIFYMSIDINHLNRFVDLKKVFKDKNIRTNDCSVIRSIKQLEFIKHYGHIDLFNFKIGKNFV